MELRWTKEAVQDLERVTDYLFEHAPERAEALVCALYDAPATLLAFPQRGRTGRKHGTRELVITALPYLVIYRVRGEAIQILRILHGAQKWP